MKRVTIGFLLITFFSLGFVTHAVLVGNRPLEITALSQPILGVKDPDDDFITSVDYNGDQFNRRSVTVKKGNYIAITNKSRDQLMWLISDESNLNTQRGYGEGEKLQLTLLKEGEFKVVNKLNTKAYLNVVVQP